MSRRGADRCREMLARNHLLAKKITAPDFPLKPFQALQSWQRQRLAESYSDLSSQASYRPACEFFLDDLYGGLDFLERDQDVAKVMPVMVKFLPGRFLVAMADAFELQAISLEFDMSMVAQMDSANVTKLSTATYAQTYRSCGDRPLREKQIQIMQELGHELAQLAHKPFVTQLIRLMRGPANAAGFKALQSFLEAGVISFRKLDDPAYFINTIYAREWLSMQKLFAGEADPFSV